MARWRIAVQAAGINFADLLLISGQYQEKPAFPFTPGMECSGMVTEVGGGVSSLKTGDRVMTLTGTGAYAEEVVIDANRVLQNSRRHGLSSPPRLSPWRTERRHGAFDWRAHLKPGEWLLVFGAAGGVGLTAVEVGKAMAQPSLRAPTVRKKLAIAKEHGADHLIDYSRGDIREGVKLLTRAAAPTWVYDPVGGDAFDASLRSIAWGGRVILLASPPDAFPRPRQISSVKNLDVIPAFTGVPTKPRQPNFCRLFAKTAALVRRRQLQTHVSPTL